MHAKRDRLEQFRKRTGARAVTGYRRDVDNIEALAFELLLLQALGTYRRISAPDNYVWEKASGLYESLGFEYQH